MVPTFSFDASSGSAVGGPKGMLRVTRSRLSSARPLIGAVRRQAALRQGLATADWVSTADWFSADQSATGHDDRLVQRGSRPRLFRLTGHARAIQNDQQGSW